MANTRKIESLSGTGPVRRKNGDFIKNAEYVLQVFQEYREVRTKDGIEEIPGSKGVRGRVIGPDNFALMRDAAVLTLRVRDGRYLDFQVADLDGWIAPNSGLYEGD